MIRTMKALGLAIVAVAAMSMAAASLAQGSQLHATHNGNVVITGHQHAGENVFQVTTSLAEDKGPKVKCTQTTFESTEQFKQGTQVTTDELTVTPVYSGCTAFGQNATVKMNGCHYTATGASTPALTADVDVVCATAGKQIEITTAICQVKVPPQTTSGHITFANIAAPEPHHVTATVTVNQIKHEYSAGIGCAHTKAVQTQDADYEGFITFKAYKHANIVHQVQRGGDGHLYTEYTHTQQVGLQAT